jgi:hypothetical protein
MGTPFSDTSGVLQNQGSIISVSVDFDQNQIVALPEGDGADGPSGFFIGPSIRNLTVILYILSDRLL